MLQIIMVVFNPLANRSVTPPAADLSPAGDARFQGVPFHVAGNISPKNLNEVRPLGSRSYQAHVSTQHIDELREFIQPRRPQDSAQTRHPLILRRCPSSVARIGAGRCHGREFIDPKLSTVLSHALLFEKNRGRGTQLEGNCNKCQERRQQNERQHRDPEIQDAL